MIEITGNNLSKILHDKAQEATDPNQYREDKLKLLDELRGKNRIGGLLRGSYQLSLLEAIMIKEIFELDSIDDVIEYRVLTKDAVSG